MNATDLAAGFLASVKKLIPADHYSAELAKYSMEELGEDLSDINSRKCFWINLYNAFTQRHMLDQKPDLSTGSLRYRFFSNKNISIANHRISLNDIEHGMLRHSSVWWSYGYLKKISVSPFEKKFRVPLDYRIHFALNCGAESCPLISFYSVEKINDELDEAMKIFLQQDVKYISHSRTVIASPIFSWYRGDFGGKKGIINLLWSQHSIPANHKIRLKYSVYDWTVKSGNFLDAGSLKKSSGL